MNECGQLINVVNVCPPELFIPVGLGGIVWLKWLRCFRIDS